MFEYAVERYAKRHPMKLDAISTPTPTLAQIDDCVELGLGDGIVLYTDGITEPPTGGVSHTG
jgi:hypothetical protein